MRPPPSLEWLEHPVHRLFIVCSLAQESPAQQQKPGGEWLHRPTATRVGRLVQTRSAPSNRPRTGRGRRVGNAPSGYLESSDYKTPPAQPPAATRSAGSRRESPRTRWRISLADITERHNGAYCRLTIDRPLGVGAAGTSAARSRNRLHCHIHHAPQVRPRARDGVDGEALADGHDAVGEVVGVVGGRQVAVGDRAAEAGEQGSSPARRARATAAPMSAFPGDHKVHFGP